MKISILGTGWLGWPVAQYLKEKGHEVTSSTRSPQKLAELQNNGIRLCLVDLNDESKIEPTFFDADILLVITPVKELAIFERLISYIEKSEIKKVIYTSSTSVYPTTNGWVNETSPTNESPYLDIENLFRTNNHFQTTIIRFAGLFANDRQPGNFFRNSKIIDHPEGFVNLIHRDDCQRIIEQIIAQNKWNETFNACADTHPSRRAFYTKEILNAGRPHPIFNEDAINEYKLISNEKLKKELDYTFVYGDLMADWK